LEGILESVPAVRLKLGRLFDLLAESGIGQNHWPFRLGVGVALATTRVLGSFLHDLAPTDASSFTAAACALVVIAGIAGCLPTRRAASRDPMEVLRAD